MSLPSFVEGTDIEVLHRLTNHGDKYGYTSVTYNKNRAYMPIKQSIERFDIKAEVDIPLSEAENIDMTLIVPKGGKPKYTMQYRNSDWVSPAGKHEVLLRCDTAHGGPHIDFELDGIKVNVITLHQPPADYEATINLILRTAEKEFSPLIGLKYWLYPTGITNLDLVQLAVELRRKYELRTSLTDLTRFTSLHIMQESIFENKRHNPADHARIIGEEVSECKKAEQQNGGIALEAIEIQIPKEISILPFPICRPPMALRRNEVYDNNGVLLPRFSAVAIEYDLNG